MKKGSFILNEIKATPNLIFPKDSCLKSLKSLCLFFDFYILNRSIALHNFKIHDSKLL